MYKDCDRKYLVVVTSFFILFLSKTNNFFCLLWIVCCYFVVAFPRNYFFFLYLLLTFLDRLRPSSICFFIHLLWNRFLYFSFVIGGREINTKESHYKSMFWYKADDCKGTHCIWEFNYFLAADTILCNAKNGVFYRLNIQLYPCWIFTYTIRDALSTLTNFNRMLSLRSVVNIVKKVHI